MASGRTVKKPDLQDRIDQAIDILDDVCAPGSNRQELAEAIRKALDILGGEEEEEIDSDDED